MLDDFSSNIFQRLATDLEQQTTDLSSRKNIVDFIQEDIDHQKWGIELNRKQWAVLKSFYRLPLTEEETSILQAWREDDRTDWREDDPDFSLPSDREYQALILECGRRGSKCVNLDSTYVFTAQGIRLMREFQHDTAPGRSCTLNEAVAVGTGRQEAATGFYNNGRQPTKRVVTGLGYEIEGTAEHRVKAVSETGAVVWRRLDEVQEGEFLCLSSGPNLWPRDDRIGDAVAWAEGEQGHPSDDVLKSSREVVVTFLRGLFEVWGSFGRRSLQFRLADRDRARRVQLLLLNLGIIAGISPDETDVLVTVSDPASRSRILAVLDLDCPPLKPQRQEKDPFREVPCQGAVCEALCQAMPELTRVFGDDDRRQRTPQGLTPWRLRYATRWMRQTGNDKVFPELYRHLDGYEQASYFFDAVQFIEEREADTGDLCVPARHSYIAGGIVSHNTLIASIITVYEFYKLAMSDSPQAEFGISSNTPISIIVLATSSTQAKRGVFRQVANLIPVVRPLAFLVNEGKIDVKIEEVNYEEKLISVYSGNSKSSSQVGQSTIMLVMDEVARFPNSSTADDDGESDSQALELWHNVGINAMSFGEKAKRIAISSAWYEGDAIQKLYESSKLDESWLGFRLRSWDLNPDQASRENSVVKSEYNTNPRKAALEFEGIRYANEEYFFNTREIKQAFRGKERFRHYRTVTSDGLVANEIVEVRPCSYPVVMHLDPAVTRDSYAMAYGHSEYSDQGHPIVVVDGVLAWEPDENHPVSILSVQRAILAVHYANPIQKLSADHKEGSETLQRCKMHGIPTEGQHFSNRMQLEMYEVARQLLHEGRLVLPTGTRYTTKLYDELARVTLEKGQKITHPRSGSKDIADCVAAVCWHLGRNVLPPTTTTVSATRLGASQLGSERRVYGDSDIGSKRRLYKQQGRIEQLDLPEIM